MVGIQGDASEDLRSRFARDAEGLQARAYQIGLAIGMSSLSVCCATSAKGSIAFRFARDSGEEFDAKGVFADEEKYTVSSLISALD